MGEIKFYYTGIEDTKQSGFYPVSKSEVIDYFQKLQSDYFKPLELVKQHKKIEFMLPGDRGTVYRFLPVNESDYQFQISITMDFLPPLGEDMLKLMEGKEPVVPEYKQVVLMKPGS